MWEFLVEVNDGQNIKCNFTTKTDMDWDEFKGLTCAQLDAQLDDVCLGYWISSKTHSWTLFTCQFNWSMVATHLKEKAFVAWTQVVRLEWKNMVSKKFSSTREKALALLRQHARNSQSN